MIFTYFLKRNIVKLHVLKHGDFFRIEDRLYQVAEHSHKNEKGSVGSMVWNCQTRTQEFMLNDSDCIPVELIIEDIPPERQEWSLATGSYYRLSPGNDPD